MRLLKLLAAVVLTISLYSCACEDVNLGKLEFTNELISFLPAEPVEAKSYYATFDNSKHRMELATQSPVIQTTIPVRKINYSGKFDLNSCKEYYTAEEKEITGHLESTSQFSFKLIYRKDADKQRFNDINIRNQIKDVLEIVVGYNNVFPKPVNVQSALYNSYATLRHFYFRDAVTSDINNVSSMQEFLPTITLNGVEHKNVYHIYLTNMYSSFYPEERLFNEQHALDHVKGIYLKEGMGIVHAYTSKGKEVNITVE